MQLEQDRAVGDFADLSVDARRRSRNVIFALGFATAGEGVFLGGVLPILPAIGRHYQIAPGEAFWINAVFLLAVGVTCPALSRLGDIYGHRKLTLITLAISVLGIALHVVAPNYAMFLAGRFLLGLCPAITPLAIGVFRKSLPLPAARFGIGAIAAAMTAGHAIGPLFAGYVFSGTGSIQWVFASWIALLAPAFAIVAWLVPESPPPSRRPPMDWLGAALLGIGVAAVLFGFAYGPKAGWGAASVVVAFAAGLACLAGWYAYERRVAFPLVDLRMLGNREARPYYLSSLLYGATYYGSQTTVVLYLTASYQKWGFGFSASVLTLAWIMVPQNVLNMLGALSVAAVARRFGGYRGAGVLGAALQAIGFGGMLAAGHTLWLFVVFAVMTGLGSGFMQPTLSGKVSEVCDESQRGISAGMFQTFKNIGGSMSSALGSALFAVVLIDGTHVASKAAYMVAFSTCLGLSLIVLFVIGRATPGASKATGARRDERGVRRAANALRDDA